MNPPPAAAAEPAALRLQVGGTLVPGRHLYIARPEDELLFELLSGGEYVNVLASRQVGKSSLMLRTAYRLREQGGRFAVVDLTVLGVCLVGVATPDELIKDRRTTPYNVGRTLWLGDFDATRDDLAPLVAALGDDHGTGAALLARVLHWTGDHPFLTTRLCHGKRSTQPPLGGDALRLSSSVAAVRRCGCSANLGAFRGSR